MRMSRLLFDQDVAKAAIASPAARSAAAIAPAR
jgi:hypothetical protein